MAGRSGLSERQIRGKAVLFALFPSEGDKGALPSLSQSLPLGEIFHKAVSSTNKYGQFSENLTGCNSKGAPLVESHGHMHVLPLDLDADSFLDHILAWIPAGWNTDEEKRLLSIQRLYAREKNFSLTLHPVASGDLDDFCSSLPQTVRNLQSFLALPEGSTEWISATPFVAPRYLKKNGRNSLTGQLLSELTSRGIPEPLDILILNAKSEAPGPVKDLLSQQHDFVRKRARIPPPADFGYSIFLRFEQPCFGPICLGYGSHFGLGLFHSPECR